jgi:predicted nuclease of predicted toxin-antitoxin system
VKVLLDECLPRRLAAELTGHEVKTVPRAGWAGIKNGELLKLAEADFNVFVTVDRNLSFQQNLAQLKIAVIVLRAKSNRFQDLLPLVPKILTVLMAIKCGELMEVSA